MDSFLKDVIAGGFSTALTKSTLHRRDGQEHSGTGHFAWKPDGCEMNVVTNGGAIVQREFGTFPGKPGEIIPDEHYLTLTENAARGSGWVLGFQGSIALNRLDGFAVGL
ncbi:hypothetical protein K227x_34920 [Rubripirellula lacrimiformis]|uniref:Uncharacterized protein n=1 Tax=Rubripirellula lacrimiformis TaxID=1930273 RepID=A0A517ND75_9BACT|nr:hypothetical protein [Rubripirellula lacrimiformis]QDT05094.1 hypothetical protein K227x_34920 [Rubripirellula lacrimiformis]